MSDAVLVEHFHAAHKHKRTGVLTARNNDGLITVFAFEKGDPVAIDFGTPKERMLADALLEYHRIGAEFHQALIGIVESGGGTVSEIVLKHQAATEDELTRTTLSMVEDALCRAFSGRSDKVDFDPSVAADSLDYGTSAFRLRIEAEVLLRTATQRVQEIRHLTSDSPGWLAVYAFDENSQGSAILTDYEKRILNFVDGRRTIQDIAEACRDSSLNMARLLRGLVEKGVIKRISTERMAQATTAMGEAPVPPFNRGPQPGRSPAGDGEFEVLHSEAQPRSRALTVVLAVVLLVLVLVGVLVVQYNQDQAKLQETMGRIVELAAKGEWQAATEQVNQARTEAGNDYAAKKKVEQLDKTLRDELNRESETITKLIAEGDFPQAHMRLGRLPASEAVTRLKSRLTTEEEKLRQRGAGLARLVESRLAADDLPGALATLAGYQGLDREKLAARETLDRWRDARIEESQTIGQLVGRKRTLLTRVLAAQPTESQEAEAHQGLTEVETAEAELREQIRLVQELLDQGDADGALSDLGSRKLIEKTEGSPLASEVSALKDSITQRRAAQVAFRQAVGEALRELPSGDRMKKAISSGQALAESSELKGASARSVQGVVEVLRKIAAVPGDLPPKNQAERLEGIAADAGLDEEMAGHLQARIERLRGIEQSAMSTIETCRALVREGELERAERQLSALMTRPELATTDARRTAQLALDEVRAAAVRRQGLRQQLADAVMRGDSAASTSLAREIGLPYLPMVVSTFPAGAEVWRDEAKLGVTPLVLDLPAAERPELKIELRLPGYRPRVLLGTEADAGWKLAVRLERLPALKLALGQAVTSRPSVIGNRVVVANRAGAFVITQEGKATEIAFDTASGGPVENPIYAPAVPMGDGFFVATRDLVGILVDQQGVRRVALGGSTDQAVVSYQSPVIVDRIWLICAGTDGVLHACDPKDARASWHGPSGDAFAGPPCLVGDRVLTARRNGLLESSQCDEGRVLGRVELSAPIAVSWPAGAGLAAYAGSDLWTWDGKEVVRSALPAPAVAGGPGIFTTAQGRIWLAGEGGWKDVGRHEGALSTQPLAWNGHAVLVCGRTLHVLGKRGFILESRSEFLAPVLMGDALVVTEQSGDLAIYQP